MWMLIDRPLCNFIPHGCRLLDTFPALYAPIYAHAGLIMDDGLRTESDSAAFYLLLLGTFRFQMLSHQKFTRLNEDIGSWSH